MPEASAKPSTPECGPRRLRLPGARPGRLQFAQVREDPLLEIEALRPGAADTVVVVSSGGCTALSLLASGAGRVVAVDVSAAQNHLVELKAAAAAHLRAAAAIAFLGGAPQRDRWASYLELRWRLTPDARGYWDARRRAVRGGVLNAGWAERWLGLLTTAVRWLIHPRARIRRLLACDSLEKQRELYQREWNTRRWRALFAVLFHRRPFRSAFAPGFVGSLEQLDLARHFHALVERGLTQLPVSNNYFLHHLLSGRYPPQPDGVPPYLRERDVPTLAGAVERLQLVDGGYTEYLRTCADRSIQAFALSNICEWLTPSELDALWSEIARTAASGARLCLRNFIGWTEVPERWRGLIVEDRRWSEALSRRDRSLAARRIVVTRIGGARTVPLRGRASGVRTREADASDNAALIRLARDCPMGNLGLCTDRAPDFFALDRLQGEPSHLFVAEDARGRLAGCVSVAERRVYLHGRPAPAFYASDLKVAPAQRNRGVADALTRRVAEVCRRTAGEHVPVLLTVLAGNRPMEQRAFGPRGLPSFARFATIRAHSIPLLWERRGDRGVGVAPAQPGDLEEMAAVWRRVASSRSFAVVHDAASLGAWISAVPGLGPDSYLLARRAGRLLGFLAVWDTSAFKRAIVTRYPGRLALARHAYSAAARVFGAAPLPRPGAPLNALAVAHLAVASDQPEVLRALLVRACNAARTRASFLMLGLDARDPLGVALRGFFAQTVDVDAYVTTAAGRYDGPPLDDGPLHHEVALA